MLQGTYPVIFLSFADVKADNYLSAREGILQELTDVYNQNAFVLHSDRLTAQDKEAFIKQLQGCLNPKKQIPCLPW